MEIEAQLHDKWLIFWWALMIGAVALGIAWRMGFFKPFKSSFLPAISGEDVLRGFCAFVVMEVFVVPLFLTFFMTLMGWQVKLETPQAKVWLNLFMVLGGFVAAIFAYSFLSAEKRELLWKQKDHVSLHPILLGMAAWLICFPIVLAFNQIISIAMWHLFHHDLVEQSVVIGLREAKEFPFLFALTALAIVTIVPFTEEFLFRGLLQTWLKRKLGLPWLAVIIASLVFACFHFTMAQGVTNIELLSSLFLLSCMLGYLFERERTLWASIGLHGFFNLMSLLMIFQE